MGEAKSISWRAQIGEQSADLLPTGRRCACIPFQGIERLNGTIFVDPDSLFSFRNQFGALPLD